MMRRAGAAVVPRPDLPCSVQRVCAEPPEFDGRGWGGCIRRGGVDPSKQLCDVRSERPASLRADGTHPVAMSGSARSIQRRRHDSWCAERADLASQPSLKATGRCGVRSTVSRKTSLRA